MHDAYEAIPIIEKLPASILIESIATYEDNLLIGTKQGHLLMYSVLPSQRGDERFDVQIARSNKYFSKKPIVQIEAVPEFHILVCLSDNVISVHDMTMPIFPLLFTIDRTRGASLFALDNQKTTTLTGEEACTLRLCVVVRRRLQLFYWKNRSFHNLSEDLCVPDTPRAIAWCAEAVCVGFRQEYCLIKLTGEQTGLISTNKSIEANVIRLKNDRLALCKDDKTVFLDLNGAPIHKDWITWSEPPINMEHDLPYLLAVVSNQVEVRTISPRLQIQDIKLNKPRLIKACKRSGRLFVASVSNVWCLVLVPVSQQITQLESQKHFELALQLVNLMADGGDDKQKLRQNIQNMYGFHLFCKYKFEESMNIFLGLGTDASQVIGLFPGLLPQDYINQLEYPDKPPILDGIQLENGLIALISYLTQIRHTLMKDLNKPDQNSTIEVDGSSTALVEGNTTIKSKNQLHQIVDTTLVKCYLRTNDALVASLLRLPDNNCHVEETERALKQFQKYNDLIILYRCKGLHQKALELLERQASIEDSPLKGPQETVKYLQHLGNSHLPLIFRFAKWVLKDFPTSGLKVFADDLAEIEALPRDRVYSYLLELDENLVIPYLEYVISTWNEKSTLLHNALALQYLNKILKSLVADHRHELEELNFESDECDASEVSRLRKKLRSHLEESLDYDPEMLLVHFPFDRLFEERALLLGKLGRHEQALAIYTLVLQSPEQAEEYCLRNYDEAGNQELYLMLFRMYLHPTESVLLDVMAPWLNQPAPNVEIALKLLKDHPLQIDPLKVIENLPDDIFLSELQSFLEHVLQGKVAKKRNCQILKGLLYAEQLQVHEQRIDYQSQKIVITDLNICAECKKRINVSAFIQYPTGDIVHFYCREKYQSSHGR